MSLSSICSVWHFSDVNILQAFLPYIPICIMYMCMTMNNTEFTNIEESIPRKLKWRKSQTPCGLENFIHFPNEVAASLFSLTFWIDQTSINISHIIIYQSIQVEIYKKLRILNLLIPSIQLDIIWFFFFSWKIYVHTTNKNDISW